MGMLKFEVPHSLSKDEAKKRVMSLLSLWNQKYGMKIDWTGDSARLVGKAMGIHIEAMLQVFDNRIGGEGPDPGLLLRGQAQKYLTRKFTAFLDPSKSLSELEKEA